MFEPNPTHRSPKTSDPTQPMCGPNPWPSLAAASPSVMVVCKCVPLDSAKMAAWNDNFGSLEVEAYA